MERSGVSKELERNDKKEVVFVRAKLGITIISAYVPHTVALLTQFLFRLQNIKPDLSMNILSINCLVKLSIVFYY